MKKSFWMFFLIICGFVYCQDVKGIQAFTEEGKRVLLKPDGTWQYIESIKKSEYDFRKINWGMSKTDVKKTESGEIINETDDIIFYNGEIAGLKTWIIYIFVSDKLVRTKYFIIESHSNDDLFITDYNSVKTLLIKKYEKPTEDEQIWRDDLYKSDKNNWGLAISAGHMVYYTKWETEETIIFLSLSGDNFKIQFQIEYSSKILSNLEKKVKEEKTINDL